MNTNDESAREARLRRRIVREGLVLYGRYAIINPDGNFIIQDDMDLDEVDAFLTAWKAQDEIDARLAEQRAQP